MDLLALLPSHTGDTGVTARSGPMSTLMAALSDNSNNTTHQKDKLRICIRKPEGVDWSAPAGKNPKRQDAPKGSATFWQWDPPRSAPTPKAYGSGPALMCSVSFVTDSSDVCASECGRDKC